MVQDKQQTGNYKVKFDYSKEHRTYGEFKADWALVPSADRIRLFWMEGSNKYYDDEDSADSQRITTGNAERCAKGADIAPGGEVGVILQPESTMGQGFLPRGAVWDIVIVAAIILAFFAGRALKR